MSFEPLGMRRVANAFAGLSTDGVPATSYQHGGVRRGMWLVQASARGRARSSLQSGGSRWWVEGATRYRNTRPPEPPYREPYPAWRTRPPASRPIGCQLPARRCLTRNEVGSSRALRARHRLAGYPAAAVVRRPLLPDTATRGRPNHHVKSLTARRGQRPAASLLGWPAKTSR